MRKARVCHRAASAQVEHAQLLQRRELREAVVADVRVKQMQLLEAAAAWRGSPAQRS